MTVILVTNVHFVVSTKGELSTHHTTTVFSGYIGVINSQHALFTEWTLASTVSVFVMLRVGGKCTLHDSMGPTVRTQRSHVTKWKEWCTRIKCDISREKHHALLTPTAMLAETRNYLPKALPLFNGMNEKGPRLINMYIQGAVLLYLLSGLYLFSQQEFLIVHCLPWMRQLVWAGQQYYN